MNVRETNYTVLSSVSFTSGSVSLRPVQQRDIEMIRIWRNAQMEVLRQSSPITEEQQVLYFDKFVWPLKEENEPKQVLLAIERDGSLIGYGGLVDISWPDKRAEVSFLLDSDIEGIEAEKTSVFLAFLELMATAVGQELGLKKLWTETYAFRQSHINTLEKAGFVQEGRLREHVVVDGVRVDSVVHGMLI